MATAWGAFCGTRVLEIVKKHDSGGLLWKKIKLTSTRKANAKKRVRRCWQVRLLYFIFFFLFFSIAANLSVNELYLEEFENVFLLGFVFARRKEWESEVVLIMHTICLMKVLN